MSDFDKCPTCQEYAWLKTHKCLPIWLVFTEDRHEDWDEADRVYAHQEQQAVEKWAAQDDCDSAEYSIVAGTDMAVQVRRLDDPDADPTWWVVTGESVPEYHATPGKRLRCSRCRKYEDLTPGRIGQLHEACVSAGFAWARWEVV